MLSQKKKHLNQMTWFEPREFMHLDTSFYYPFSVYFGYWFASSDNDTTGNPILWAHFRGKISTLPFSTSWCKWWDVEHYFWWSHFLHRYFNWKIILLPISDQRTMTPYSVLLYGPHGKQCLNWHGETSLSAMLTPFYSFAQFTKQHHSDPHSTAKYYCRQQG